MNECEHVGVGLNEELDTQLERELSQDADTFRVWWAEWETKLNKLIWQQGKK